MRYGAEYGYGGAEHGYGAEDFVSIYDALPAPESLWSVARRLRRAYTGPVIRVRRSSDSVEQDFYGSGASGIVSPEAIRSFNGWNLLARTEEFDNAAWTKLRTSISSTSEIAPNGTATAEKLIEDTSNDTHLLLPTSFPTIVSGQTYTFSIHAKQAGRSLVYLRDNATSNVGAYFNLATGAAYSPEANVVSTAISNAGNGWYRCSVTYVSTSVSANTQLRLVSTGTTQSYLGDGASGILVWGAQLEVGTSPSTYEPRTTTGAGSSFLVTRYDQSGNARHATQATTTLQPIVCESGVPVTNSGGRLTSKHVAADARRLAVANSTNIYNFLHTTGGTVLAVSQANDTAGTKHIVSTRTGTAGAGLDFYRATTERIEAGTSRRDVAGVATSGNVVGVSTSDITSTSNSIVVLSVDPDGPVESQKVSVWHNGTLSSATNNAGMHTPFVENASTNLTIGSKNAGTDSFDGTIGDVGIWSVFFTEAQRKLVEADQGRFNTITVAP